MEVIKFVTENFLLYLLQGAIGAQEQAAGLGLTIMAVSTLAMAAFLGPRSGNRRRHGRISARICLAIGLVWQIKPVAAGPSLKLRGNGPIGLGPRSDIDFWMAGQSPPSEQLAAAMARCIQELPLEHNWAEAHDPRYEVPAEPPEFDANVVDIATVHATAWIAAPYYEAETIDFHLRIPTTLAQLQEAVQQTSNRDKDYEMEFVPTIPQLGEGYVSYIAYPKWLKDTERVTLLIDATDIGGGTFAAYVPNPTTRERVLMHLVEGWPAGLRAFLGGHDRPMRTGHEYHVLPGTLIKIMRPHAAPRWKDEVANRLQDPRRWSPEAVLPGPLDGLHMVYQAADDQVLEEIASDDERPLEVSAEEALRYEHGDVWVKVPNERLLDLAHMGRRVWGQVAVLDGWEQHGHNAPVIFADIRGLALFPQWLQLEGTVFKPVDFYETLDLPPLPGWTLLVQGGNPRDDGENIDVADGEVLHLFLAKDDSAENAESEESSGGDGGDAGDGGDDGSDSSSTFDAMPDSDDLTTPSPHDQNGPPRGPPRPRPVNAPPDRSRSPRRHGDHESDEACTNVPDAPCLLRLHDHIDGPNYDLTRISLPLPHRVDDIWPLFCPWSGEWLQWNLEGIDMNAEAEMAVRQACPWQQLLMDESHEAPQIHIYTDGSANEKEGISGYSAVILLKLGTAFAIFGLLGGQLLGKPASQWPLAGPAALTAEQVAVAAALLWALQARALLPRIDCLLHVDCLAAGRAADGSWSPVDALSVQVHNLELALRELEGVTVQIAHVKGHSGDGWNELADAVAKSASRGQRSFAEPPEATCRALLDTNLDWLGFEMAARKNGGAQVYDGNLCWSEMPRQPPLLQPEQLIPTEMTQQSAAPNHSSAFYLKACTFNVQGLGGNFRYMEEQFESAEYNVVMMQETKTGGGQCQSQRYYRLASDAQRHWGTAIWLSKTKGIMELNGHAVHPEEANTTVVCATPRLLVVVSKIGQAKIGIVAAHCPHATKPKERSDFLELLTRHLASLKKVQLLLVGVDLNGRLPLNYPNVSGDLEFQDPDAQGEQAAQIFQDCGVWAPSTYASIHVGESATHVHHTGLESRIDYLLLGGTAHVSRARSSVDQGMDNGSPNDDHRAVAVELQGELCVGHPRGRLKRPRYDLDKMNTAEGRRLMSQACRAFQQPAWEVHPDEHCHRVEVHLKQTLETYFPKPEQPGRASYIPSEVWAIRRRKGQLRWRTRHRRGLWRGLLRAAVHAWKEDDPTPFVARLKKQALLYDLVAGAVRLATDKIRKMIAAAKDQFLRGLAATGPTDVASILQRAKKAGLGSKARQMVGRSLPKLMNPRTGEETTCVAERDTVWLQFFGEQEVGHILPTTRFIREAQASEDEVRDDWQWKHLPSTVEIEEVLRTTARNKCAGLDGVPSDALRCSPSDFARMIQPLYVKALLGGRQPLQWRGGVLFEAYKGAGAQCDVSSHRSLYISSFIGKSLHRVMRGKVRDQLDAFLHPLHCGSRQGMPVLFPSLFVVEHLRRCLQQGLSTAVIYVDTKAAYYRLVRQLATGDLEIDANVERLFHRFGLDGEDMTELRDLILDGGMLQMAEIDGPIRAAVRDFHRDSWFTSRFTDGSAICRSTAGSRPGASWADTVFAVIYARILYRVHECMEGEQINFSLPWNQEQGIFTDQPGDQWQSAFDTTWADDSAYALQADTPGELLSRASRVGSLILSAFRSHGLDPNLKRHKTSAMIKVRGPGAKKARREYFGSGKPELVLPDLGEGIPVVPSYKHLGCVLDIEARLHLEARHRTALAAAAYEKAKDLLLQNRDLSLSTRALLFQAAVVPSYYNLEVWIAEGKHWEQLCDAFSRLVRRLLCRDIPGEDLFRVPLPLAHWATDCWPLGMFARRSRLSAIVSLAKKGPPVLWAMLQNETDWCAQARRDLLWLTQGEEDQWPRVEAAAWPQWWHLLRSRPEMVKRRVRKANERDFQYYKRRAASDVCHWYMYRQLPPETCAEEPLQPWTCGICDKSFGKKSALSVHFFGVHGRKAEYRFFLQGTTCKSCGKNFHTPGRLEDHLRATRKCVRVLQREQKPLAQAPPGYGSRGRRKTEADQYTPAPPTMSVVGSHDGRESEGRQWNTWQCQLHERLCDTLLEDFVVEEIEEQIEQQLRRHPLFYDEICEVTQHLREEIEMIHADHELQQWSKEQFTAMQAGLLHYEQNGFGRTSRTQRETQRLSSRATFCAAVASFDWMSAYLRLWGDNGTQKSPLYSLSDSWETAWHQTCSGEISAVVVKDPLLLLPQELKAVWNALMKGEWPRLKAPKSFWENSLAAPSNKWADGQRQLVEW
ncbi:unnamed protein product [Symbiodinium sp. CCMP2592]|nr:unnamed protein product [Symbiodinium sp. CCMP2592]